MRKITLRHPCGHEEVHRLEIWDAEHAVQRNPDDREMAGIVAELIARPCNACLAGMPAGTPGRVIGAARIPDREEVA